LTIDAHPNFRREREARNPPPWFWQRGRGDAAESRANSSSRVCVTHGKIFSAKGREEFKFSGKVPSSILECQLK
jgi:hypothetical protein